MTPDEYQERLRLALERSNADRIQAFFPTANEMLPRTIRKALADKMAPATRQAAILGGGAKACIIFASELVPDDVESRLEPAVWSIFDAVSLNARDLAAEGVRGTKKLERRIGRYMLRLVQDGPPDDPARLLSLVKFWTVISVARGALRDDQKTGAELAVSTIMMERFGLDEPG